MNAILLALALALQAQPAPPPVNRPLPSEDPAPRELSPAHALYDEEASSTRQSTPEARRTMHAFGACVARGSARMAAETLAMDFRTRAYQSRLIQMTNNNRESCFRRRGRMRSSNLLLAGGIAEELLSRDSAPLNVRLARAAADPETRSFSPSDTIAICVVRSVPDDIARLFATEVASEAEAQALAALAPAAAACNRTGLPFSVSHPGLRAILATAAFRTLHRAEAAQ